MPFDYDFTEELKEIIRRLRKKDPERAGIIHKKVKQIINSDEIAIEHYKPLRHDLKGEKRVHIDKSFVLTFRFDRERKFILFTDFDHHDSIYKK